MMNVEQGSKIASEYRNFNKRYRDLTLFITQQKAAFPMTYYEYRRLDNKRFINDFKK
jgi:hypothetical protein